jgi:hypothetical protein
MTSPKESESDDSQFAESAALIDDSTLERLGRERPAFFAGAFPEVGFCFSIVMSQILAVRLLIASFLEILTGV